ncbi:MAG TPA: hypothetical protein PLU98_06865, partial [Mesotoga infera]|nr:hypothetical protein [Mesotoga infera]
DLQSGHDLSTHSPGGGDNIIIQHFLSDFNGPVYLAEKTGCEERFLVIKERERSREEEREERKPVLSSLPVMPNLIRHPGPS